MPEQRHHGITGEASVSRAPKALKLSVHPFISRNVPRNAACRDVHLQPVPAGPECNARELEWTGGKLPSQRRCCAGLRRKRSEPSGRALTPLPSKAGDILGGVGGIIPRLYSDLVNRNATALSWSPMQYHQFFPGFATAGKQHMPSHQ